MAAKPAVFVTRAVPDNVAERLRRDYAVRLNQDNRKLDADEIVAGAAEADALIVVPSDRIEAALIDRLAERVRAIATFSVGFEHVDLAAAKRRGIVVTNTPGVLTEDTADIAMLLLLGAARRAHEGEETVRQRKFPAWSPTFMRGTKVSGKRLGIFGFGRIGQSVAQRARGFDMEVHYSDLRRLPPEVEQGAIFHPTPEELLPVSQFLTIHANLTPDNRHFLNAERIALLPDGAIVVNTARGPLVHDDSLIAALKSGKLAAAGLDVYENEPNVHAGYLDLPNVFLLPHLGSATMETRDAMGFKCCDNLDAFFGGKTPPDRVA